MRKDKFLKELGRRLNKMPPAEMKSTLEYYAEIIADRMEEGNTEEEAVAMLGDIEALAAEHVSEAEVTVRKRKRRRGGIWVFFQGVVPFLLLLFLAAVNILLYAGTFVLCVMAPILLIADWNNTYYLYWPVSWGLLFISVAVGIIVFCMGRTLNKWIVRHVREERSALRGSQSLLKEENNDEA